MGDERSPFCRLQVLGINLDSNLGTGRRSPCAADLR